MPFHTLFTGKTSKTLQKARGTIKNDMSTPNRNAGDSSVYRSAGTINVATSQNPNKAFQYNSPYTQQPTSTPQMDQKAISSVYKNMQENDPDKFKDQFKRACRDMMLPDAASSVIQQDPTKTLKFVVDYYVQKASNEGAEKAKQRGYIDKLRACSMNFSRYSDNDRELKSFKEHVRGLPVSMRCSSKKTIEEFVEYKGLDYCVDILSALSGRTKATAIDQPAFEKGLGTGFG